MFEQIGLFAEFDGATIDPVLDPPRLGLQQRRVFQAMAVGDWLTLAEIRERTGDPEASISARLRDLRKNRHGACLVERRRRGDPADGLFEYRLSDLGRWAA